MAINTLIWGVPTPKMRFTAIISAVLCGKRRGWLNTFHIPSQRTEMPLIQTSTRRTSAKHNYRVTSIMRENYSGYFENQLSVFVGSARLNAIVQKSKLSEDDTA